MRFRLIARVVASLMLTLTGGCGNPPVAGENGTPTRPGEILWHVPTAEPPLLSASITADASTAFYYLTGRKFAALRLSDRRPLWTATGDESSDANDAMEGIELCAGSVIFGTAGAAYAYEKLSGNRRWRWQPSQGGQLYYAGPACSGTTLLFGTGKPMRVYAVDAMTGVELWNTRFGDSVAGEGFLTTPAVDDGVVVSCSREFSLPFRGAISAFNIASGEVLWRFTWTPPPPLNDASCALRVRIKDGIVAASVDDGRIFGLDLHTGALRWTAPPVALFATPRDERPLAIVDSNVIAGSLSGRLIAHDLRTGVQRWNVTDRSAGGSIFNFELVGEGGVVYGANLSGWIAAYDGATGQRRWALSKGVGLNERVFLARGVALAPGIAVGRAGDGVYGISR
jgi:outer membrane protein assembly factor BamB